MVFQNNISIIGNKYNHIYDIASITSKNWTCYGNSAKQSYISDIFVKKSCLKLVVASFNLQICLLVNFVMCLNFVFK